MTKYGLRDDMAVVFNIMPPNSGHYVAAKGKLRDIIRLLNETGWKILSAQADVDEFLEYYHGLDSTLNKEES